ncbi:MAG: hypothetical protein WD276_09405 [Actinomycetota bacterium]
MTLWVQHGYGKGQKIAELLSSGSIGGVILSPADEDVSALSSTTESLVAQAVPVLIDPQTYVWSIPGGSARHHDSHGLEVPGFHWSIPASDTQAVVEAVLQVNRNLGVSAILSPTCIQRGIEDPWTPLALQLARTTIELKEKDETILVSLVLDEAALSNWEPIENWLDILTTLSADGFYIAVSRTASYPATWEPSRLQNLLRVVYRLSVVNEYRVVLGYSDIDGLASLSAGAEAIASGWYYTLRAFSESKWGPSSFGRQANPRVLLATLLSPVVADHEGQDIAASSMSTAVIPDDALRARLAGTTTWGTADAWGQHLSELRALADEIEASGTSTPERAQHLLTRIDSARGHLQQLRDSGLVLDASYTSFLNSMQSAVAGFLMEENLS